MQDKPEIFADNELIPPEGTDGVGEAVANMFAAVVQFREDEKFPERCNRYYKMRRAKHWKYDSSEVPLLSANLIGTNHRKTVNMLTANNPTFNIDPAAELGDDAEDKLSLQKSMTDFWWNETEQQMVFRESVDVGEMYGTVSESGFYDEDIDYPVGDVMFETNDPMYCSMYPPKCRVMRKAEGFLKWYPVSVREARRRWPHVADEIQADKSLLDEIGDEREEEHRTTKPSIKQVVVNTVKKLISGEETQSQSPDDDETYVIEVWVKDKSYTVQDEAEVPVYPGNIRRVMVCSGGDVVLSDDHNPALNHELSTDILQKNYLYSRWPHTYCQPVPDTTSPLGLSDIEQLEKLNMELNKALSQFTLYKDRASRLKLVNPKDSGVSPDEMNNVDGVIRPTNTQVSQGLRYLPPPQMGMDIPQAISIYKDIFNEVAGSFSDVTQGQKKGSEVVAAKAIALLLEVEARMAQGKGQAYSKMIRERGRIYLALAQMWYTVPRYITFRKQGEKITQGVTAEDLQVPTRLGVVSGSTLPVSDIYRREEAVGLFKMRLVDQEHVLKELGIDNYREIIRRMQQGPLGQFLNKLSMAGVPKEILSLFQQIGKMEDKDVKKAIEKGEIPPFTAIIAKLVQAKAGQPQQPKPDPEMAEAQIKAKELQIKAQETAAKVRNLDAKTMREDAETELTAEKIITEQVTQRVKSEGVKLDWENIRLDKARVINDIQDKKKTRKERGLRFAADIADKKQNRQPVRTDPGRYDERGIRSNNEDA